MRSIVAVLTGCVLSISLPAQEPAKVAREKLVGVWNGYAVEGKGENPDRGAVKLELTISKDLIKAKQFKGKQDFDLGEGTYIIVLDKSPNHLDGDKKLDNPNRKEVWLGIYQLEGDTLKWCEDVRLGPRSLRRSKDSSSSSSNEASDDSHAPLLIEESPMLATLLCLCATLGQPQAEMPFVVVAKGKKSFVLEPSGKPFTPWGFNYDHDTEGRLLEDYWENDWDKVEAHFGQMKKLGANVVRIHFQVGKFMDAADKPNDKALDRLTKLVGLAEKERLYLDVTGLGCYHKADVPAWYDKLSEKDRWDVQARFWEVVAGRCAKSPAIFCYDLMNEPVVPGGKRKDGDWLGPPFGGKHFVQVITLDQQKRPRPDIARQWVKYLVSAIRKHDKRHLITVGLVDWSLDRPGLTSGFVPDKIADDLDFICVHLYPEKGKLDEALKTLEGFAAVGKPVVIEETFPLKCSMKEFGEFIEGSKKHATGWIGFYWGKPPEELRKGKTIHDAILLAWLEFFQKNAKLQGDRP